MSKEIKEIMANNEDIISAELAHTIKVLKDLIPKGYFLIGMRFAKSIDHTERADVPSKVITRNIENGNITEEEAMKLLGVDPTEVIRKQ